MAAAAVCIHMGVYLCITELEISAVGVFVSLKYMQGQLQALILQGLIKLTW